MKTRSRWHGFVVCGALAPMLASAADPPWKISRDLARELIETTRVDAQAVQKVEAQILARCQIEECDADLRSCLMKIDREYFSSLLEHEFEQALTADEMRQAIAHFRTETGLKHLEILRAEQGLGGKETLFSQTPEVRAAILAFLDTRAGYLLITRGVLRQSADARVDGQARAAFWRCRPLSR
jgi:hypothetical protein